LAEGLETAVDLPHTISYAIMYRQRIDSFNELPKEKRPPRDLWDKPYRLSQFLDKIWDKDGQGKERTDFFQYDDSEVE
jgi:hypothetical protein